MYKTRKVKQRTLKYLGRSYKLNSKGLDLETFLDKNIEQFIEETPKRGIILKLIEFELINHEFKKLKHDDYILNSEIKVEIDKIKIRNLKNKPVVLEINEGFLCEYTINSVLNFKFPNLNEKECGKYLANTLLSAGIKIDDQLFVSLFNKLFKENLQSTN